MLILCSIEKGGEKYKHSVYTDKQLDAMDKERREFMFREENVMLKEAKQIIDKLEETKEHVNMRELEFNIWCQILCAYIEHFLQDAINKSEKIYRTIEYKKIVDYYTVVVNPKACENIRRDILCANRCFIMYEYDNSKVDKIMDKLDKTHTLTLRSYFNLQIGILELKLARAQGLYDHCLAVRSDLIDLDMKRISPKFVAIDAATQRLTIQVSKLRKIDMVMEFLPQTIKACAPRSAILPLSAQWISDITAEINAQMGWVDNDDIDAKCEDYDYRQLNYFDYEYRQRVRLDEK